MLSNTFLIYVNEKGKQVSKNQVFSSVPAPILKADDDQLIEDLLAAKEKDIFQKIDSILYTYSFKSKWINENFTDSLHSKKIRVPADIPLIRYNKLVLKILAEVGITPSRVQESAYANSLTFFFKVEDEMSAKLTIRTDSRIKAKLALPASMVIIIDDFGNQWSPEYIQGFLDFPVPVTLAIIPGHIFSKRTAQKAFRNGQEVMIHMPMEPLRGSIEKETIKLTTEMGRKTITQMLAKAVVDIPHAAGLNNHEGSKGTSDPDLMKLFFDVFADSKMFFVNSLTISNTYCRQFAAESGVKYAERHIFLDDKNEEEHIEKMFRRGVARVMSGKDAILIGHARKKTCRTLLRLVKEEFPDLNYVFASEVVEEVVREEVLAEGK